MQRDIVKFEKGAILRKEMLESMYNYPHVLAESYYSHFSDGILYGLEWYEKNGKNYICAGALKYKGNIYFQPQEFAFEDMIQTKAEDREYYVYFKESPVKSTYCQDIYELEPVLETEPVSDGFCYKYVKYAFGSFRALDSKKIYGLYASPDGAGFSLPPYIIREELMPVLSEKTSKHPLDYEIMKTVYDNRPLSADFVRAYLSEYNSSDPDERVDETVSRDNVREAVDNLKKAVEKLMLPGVRLIEKTEASVEKSDDFGDGRLLV